MQSCAPSISKNELADKKSHEKSKRASKCFSINLDVLGIVCEITKKVFKRCFLKKKILSTSLLSCIVEFLVTFK